MVDNEIIMTRRYIMKDKPEFHGSDLEKIAEYYHIDQNSIIKFGANVNPLGLSDTVKKDLATHLDVISSYPDRDYKSLKATIGGYVHADPEHIVVGNGSTELISLLINQRAPKKALVLGPTYSEYARELSMIGGVIEYFHLKEEDNFVLNIPALLQTLKQDAAIDLLIICNPNNPTSSAICQKDMEIILAECKRQDIFVMIDETYVEFAPDVHAITSIPLVESYDNFMVIRGLSKFFAAPGLRFGYGITSNEAFLQMLKIHQNPWSVNSVAAYAGERMLTDTDYISKTWNLIDSERTRLCNILKEEPALKIYTPYANFILVRILKEGLTSFDLFEAAIKEHMMIRDCSSFENLDGEYIRFCIMNPEDNDRLVQCILKTVHS